MEVYTNGNSTVIFVHRYIQTRRQGEAIEGIIHKANKYKYRQALRAGDHWKHTAWVPISRSLKEYLEKEGWSGEDESIPFKNTCTHELLVADSNLAIPVSIMPIETWIQLRLIGVVTMPMTLRIGRTAT